MISLATDNTNKPTQEVQYIKLENGESLITFCSELMDGLYILHYPFVYQDVTLFNEGKQRIIGSQLSPWIQVGNQGPIPIPARQVITKITPDKDEIENYIKLVNNFKSIQANGSMIKEAEKPKKLPQKDEPPGTHLNLVASNDNITPSKSRAALDLVYDDESDEDPDFALEEEDNE